MQRPLCRGMRFFTLIWLGEVISIIGSGMSSFAIGTNLYRETGSVTLYALIGLSMAVPMILLSPIAGTLADKYDRRLILLCSSIASMFGTLALFWLVSHDRLTPLHLYLITAYRACAGSFLWPAFSAATTLIVGKEHFSRASGMTQMGASMSQIVAPLLGGLLVVPLGVDGVLLLDAFTFVFLLATLLAVRFPQPETDSQSSDSQASNSQASNSQSSNSQPGPVDGTVKGGMTIGWSFLRERPGLLWLLTLFAVLNFCTGLVQVSITPMILSFTSQRVLGMVLAVASAGSLVGGILMSVWGGPKVGQRVRRILQITAFSGTVLLLGGLQANAALVSSAAFFFMLGFPIIAGSSQAIWQSKVPPEIQGRVFAIRRMIAGSAIPFAFALAGPLADHVFEPMLAEDGALANSVGRFVGVGPGRGIAFSLVLFGLAMIITTLVGWRSRALRNLEADVADAVATTAEEEEARQSHLATVKYGLARLGPAPTLALGAALAMVTTTTLVYERPPTRLDDAAVADFSTDRAMEHMRSISQQPHYTGSPAQHQVRDYLLDELRKLGLEVEVQTADASATLGSFISIMTVENILARLPGHTSGGAVLLAAHYDSVASSPGASDNGAAVGAVLETARVLAAGRAPRNDVIFLLSDAEEIALGGARAFVDQHSWADDVAVAINFDARGHGGPTYMFQTGTGNAWWVDQFSRAVPLPRASSLLNEIYRQLPNATDFNVFLEAGYPGFNHAFIEGLTHYHSMLDRPQDVDPRSVRHQGSYALALARHFAELDWPGPEVMTAEPDENLTYFSVMGSFVVRYSKTLAWLSAVLVGTCFLAVVALGCRRGRLTLGGITQGLLAFFGTLVAISVGVTLVWFVVRDLASPVLIMGSTSGASLYMSAFACLALACFITVHAFLRRFVQVRDLHAGALVWWALLVILTCGPLAPVETNFIAVWPLLGGLLCLTYLVFGPPEESKPWLTTGVLSASAIPVLVLFVALTPGLYIGLQSLVQLSGLPLIPMIFCLGLLIPQVEILTGRYAKHVAVAVVLVFAVLLTQAVAGSLRSDLRFNMVAYAEDVDTDEAHWFSLNSSIGGWMQQFGFQPGVTGSFQSFVPSIQRKVFRSPAPRVELPHTELVVAAERRLSKDLRELDLRLTLAGGAQVRTLWFEPSSAVVSTSLRGQTQSFIPLRDFPNPTIQRVPVMEEEILTVRLQVGKPITIHVVDLLEGFPAVPGGIEPRPPGTLPAPLPLPVHSDVTMIHRSFKIGS